MSNSKNILFLFISIIFLQSCVVTNNVYLNDPTPIGRGNQEIYLGGGTGIRPRIDSVTNNTKINYSKRIKTAPIAVAGLKVGLGERMNLEVGLHFPKIIAGIGLRVGTQYSFLKKDSKFNFALGANVGTIWAEDNVKILGTYVPNPELIKQAFNGDVFLPISYNFTENFRLIITPRFSFNSVSIKRFTDFSDVQNFRYQMPILSVGALINKNFYFEYSAIYYDKLIYPHFGIAYIVSGKY